ncbi:unnamed protein product [Pylaiella littoralis]
MLRFGATATILLFLLVSLLDPARSLTSSSWVRISKLQQVESLSALPPTAPMQQKTWRMGMEQIKVTKNPSEEQIKALGARDWPTWGCGVSKFPWTYEGTETCLILEGDVTVTPDDDREPVTVGVGDLCVFPDGMSCTWDVRAPIKKHFNFA